MDIALPRERRYLRAQMNTPTPPKKIHVRATFAALYALASTIPEDGIPEQEIRDRLAGHLDPETFIGLVHELQRRQVITVRQTKERRMLFHGREYKDGLERLRLAGESLKGA